MTTVRDWFANPTSTIVSVESYNAPELTRGLLGVHHDPVPVPPPQTLYDLADYSTDFSVVFNRPRTTILAR